jgi:HD-GYP domain-containing protein (c-di-GMP phosphodiesterase class II)
VARAQLYSQRGQPVHLAGRWTNSPSRSPAIALTIEAVTPRELALQNPAAPSPLPIPKRRTEDGSNVILRRRREDCRWPRRDGVVRAACDSLAEHDAGTATHSDDVVALSHAIAEQMDLPPRERRELLAAAQLHDIGKLTVPREIIEKDGALDVEEWELIREHTVAGERILRDLPEVMDVAQIVRWSHERYDGRGYPDGLARDEIPLASRIILCADAFHAMRCDRPYRPGRSAEEAIAELRTYAGTQFDPQVVDALAAAARRLKRSRFGRVRAVAGGRMPRRALALLLTLSLAGSAAAATRGPVSDLLGGGGKERAADATCAGSGACTPAQLGPLGSPFSSGPRAGETPATKGSAARAARAAAGLTATGGVPGTDPRSKAAPQVTVPGRAGPSPTTPNGEAKKDAPASAPTPAPDAPAKAKDPKAKPDQQQAPGQQKSHGKSEQAPGHSEDHPIRKVVPEKLPEVKGPKVPDPVKAGPMRVEPPAVGKPGS